MARKKKSKTIVVEDRVINTFGDKISSEVGDYSRYPFVIEKNRRAQAFLEKHGFPKELQK